MKPKNQLLKEVKMSQSTEKARHQSMERIIFTGDSVPNLLRLAASVIEEKAEMFPKLTVWNIGLELNALGEEVVAIYISE